MQYLKAGIFFILFLFCNRQEPSLSYGYGNCQKAALSQANFLVRGEIDKFRFMFLDKSDFSSAVFPRLKGYKGLSAEELWMSVSYQVERSNLKALNEYKGAKIKEVQAPKNIETHNGMKIYRNFTIVFESGTDSNGKTISKKEDKILSAFTEINGLCRQWINAYGD